MSRPNTKPNVLYGAMWGLAMGLGVASYVATRSTSAYDVLAFIAIGPIICIASIIVGCIVFALLGPRFASLRSRKSLYLALAVAVIFTAMPVVMRSIELRRIAYDERLVFPGSDNVMRTIHGITAAKIEITMHSTAQINDVYAYYTDALSKSGWTLGQTTTTDRNFLQFSGTRPGQTLIGNYSKQTEQIRLNWYRNFATH